MRIHRLCQRWMVAHLFRPHEVHALALPNDLLRQLDHHWPIYPILAVLGYHAAGVRRKESVHVGNGESPRKAQQEDPSTAI